MTLEGQKVIGKKHSLQRVRSLAVLQLHVNEINYLLNQASIVPRRDQSMKPIIDDN